MNKYTIFAILLFVGSLSSCGMRSVKGEEVLIFSKSDYKLYYFSNNFKSMTATISDSIYFVANDFMYSTAKKDKRPYSIKICRTNNTSTDTIKLITNNNIKHQVGNFESFDIFDFYNDKTQNLGKNYPSSNEFTNYLKSIQSNNYFELLPNQECIALPRRD